MKKTMNAVFIALSLLLVSASVSQADIPPHGGNPGGGGGGSTPNYVVDYVEIGEVLIANGYAASTPWQYVSAQAISPSGSCEVLRIHYPIWEVRIYTQDSGTIYYDFFIKLIINGQLEELRFITHT